MATNRVSKSLGNGRFVKRDIRGTEEIDPIADSRSKAVARRRRMIRFAGAIAEKVALAGLYRALSMPLSRFRAYRRNAVREVMQQEHRIGDRILGAMRKNAKKRAKQRAHANRRRAQEQAIMGAAERHHASGPQRPSVGRAP